MATQPALNTKQPDDWRRRVANGFDAVLNAMAALAAILLVAIMFATVIKVVFRYGLNEGLIGVDQISGTMMLYVTFLGAAWVLRRDEHVTIDLLLSALAPKIRARMIAISSLIGAAICLTIALFGTMEVVSSWQRGVLIPAEIEYLRAINLTVIPLGCLCLGIQFLRRAANYFKGEPHPSNVPKMEG